jgi:C_GCAxxG_C_C family probable redox protein
MRLIERREGTIDMEECCEVAARLFREGYNCAQAVFTPYAELYGIDQQTALKLSAGLGAGMGRMREVCGCCSAMFLLAGLVKSPASGSDAAGKTENYRLVQQMADAFRAEAGGSIICRELLGLDHAEGTPVPDDRTAPDYKKRPCPALVQLACRIIEDMLEAHAE